MALAVELESDAVVDEPLGVHAGADAGVAEEVDRALLEHAGADARLDVGAAARLQDHGLDARVLEQPRERQARRAGPDDPHLCPGRRHDDPSSASTSCAIAKARFAAGTPQ